MFHINTQAARRPYDAALRPWLSLAEGRAARERLSNWAGLSRQPTPLWSLPGLARQLGIESLTIKDESKRSSLGSFKALGAPNALVKLVLRRWPEKGWTGPELLAGRHAFGWRGRRATRWLYAGTALLLLAYVGSRFVLEVLLQRTPVAAG